MVGKIPLDCAFVEAMVQGVPVTKYANGLTSDLVTVVWNNISEILKKRS